MKKYLSVILALIMLLSCVSLVGCSKEEETPAAGTETPAAGAETPAAGGNETAQPAEIDEETLKNSKPNEYLAEKLAAGMEPLVAYIPFVDIFFLEMLGTGVKDTVEPLGYAYTTSSAGGDVALLIQQIENYVTMGAALVITNPPDGSIVQQSFADAQAAGTYCLSYGEYVEGSNCVRIDTYESARQQCIMMDAWVNENYPDAGPGEIKVAVTENSSMSSTALKGQMYHEFLAADAKYQEVYSKDQCDGVDEGFIAAEEAMTVDSGIRVFLVYDIGTANGIDNYLIAQHEAGLLNINEFGIFVAGEDNNTRTKLGDDYSELSAFRGTILDGETVWESLADGAVKLLAGELVTPFEYLQPIYTYTNFGYSYDSRLA